MRSLLTKLFGVLFSTFFLHVSVEAADKIRIAIPGTGPFLTFSLAQKKGFFKDEGLEAEIIQIRGGSVAMAALLTGDLDYYSVVAVGARSAIQGLPIRLVALLLTDASQCARRQTGVQIGQGSEGKNDRGERFWKSSSRHRADDIETLRA